MNARQPCLGQTPNQEEAMREIPTEHIRDQVADEEERPDLSVESFSPAMRIGLLVITMFGVGLLLSMVIAAAVLPNGLLDVNLFLGAYTGGIAVGLGFFLMVIYGGLVGNNRRLGPDAKIVWFMLFASIGPVSLPVYWFMHVWPAAYEPWTEPAKCAKAPPAQPTGRPSGTPRIVMT